MKAKRIRWKELEKRLPADRLVFLDESGINLGMIRRYGRALCGKRVVDHSPLNKPKTTTVVAAIRTNGVFAQANYPGGTTKEKFLQYVRETLVPALHQGDIVVMDNLSVHHAPQAVQMIHQAGAGLLYLPPYSPDFNPIEKLWSKVKAFLRKCRALTLKTLQQSLLTAFACVTSSDCRNWFACARSC